MGILLDLMLLLAIAREGMQFASRLPAQIVGLFVAVLPFTLGMASAMRTERPFYVTNYVRLLIGQGLTLAATLLYVYALAVNGMEAAFVTLFVVTLAFYVAGRLFGMTLRAIVVIVIIAAILWPVVAGRWPLP